MKPLVQTGEELDSRTIPLQPNGVTGLLRRAGTIKPSLVTTPTASIKLFNLTGEPVASEEVVWVPDWLSKEATWLTGSLSIASGFYDLVAN